MDLPHVGCMCAGPGIFQRGRVKKVCGTSSQWGSTDKSPVGDVGDGVLQKLKQNVALLDLL